MPFICHIAELTELRGYKLTINQYVDVDVLMLAKNNSYICSFHDLYCLLELC